MLPEIIRSGHAQTRSTEWTGQGGRDLACRAISYRQIPLKQATARFTWLLRGIRITTQCRLTSGSGSGTACNLMPITPGEKLLGLVAQTIGKVRLTPSLCAIRAWVMGPHSLTSGTP